MTSPSTTNGPLGIEHAGELTIRVPRGSVLRMDLAQWAILMAHARVPYQARCLAFMAAIFKISSSDELASICGVHRHTIAEWQKLLLSGGWVLVQRGGGTVSRIIKPAVQGIEVEFDDIVPRTLEEARRLMEAAESGHP